MPTTMTLVDWAQIGSAAGSLLAVLVSSGVFLYQRDQQARAVKRADAKGRRADAALLLSLQNLASELRRMIVLAAFQNDAVGNDVFYPDIAAEYGAIALLLQKQPLERVALLGKMAMVLHLRRIAAELVMIYTPAPPVGSQHYRKNRNRLTELGNDCSKYAHDLVDDIKVLDNEVYQANIEEMNRL